MADLGAAWVAAFLRSEVSDRFYTAAHLAHDETAPLEDLVQKSGCGGPWRAFLSKRTRNVPGPHDHRALAVEYHNLSPAEFNELLDRSDEAAALSDLPFGAGGFGPRSRAKARVERRDHLIAVLNRIHPRQPWFGFSNMQ